MALDIKHDETQRRFTTKVDGVTCVLDYTLQGDVMTITHTGVPEAVGGRGIAGELVRAAVATARARGWKVVSACSYAQAWLQRHPQEAEGLR
ncbi:MAG: GNAT family N-acetyltransferase [Fulvimonas sp.]|nr:GNAT family N-acetyltransferase [Fulvimonas sp.]